MHKANPQSAKRPSWTKSLGGKFVLLTISVLSITLGASALYNYQEERKHLFQMLDERISSIITFSAEISPNAVLSYDFDVLNIYMKTLSQGEDIVYAAVVSTEGDAMTPYLDEENEYIKNVRQQHGDISTMEVIKNVNQHPDITSRELPIEFDSQILASIQLGISKKRIEEESRHTLEQQLIVNFLIVVILSTLIYVVYRLNTLRPIRGLVQGAVRISEGSLNENVKVYSDDELGHLATSFNQMMHTLRSNIEEKDNVLSQLQELNKTLENRVEARTADLENANKRLEHLALHDALTGLPNRALIQDRLNQAIYNAQRSKQPFSVIMMDLDRFKEVNDTLGHDSGDQLLLEVGDRLTECLRKCDTVGRLGGDEFALILPQTSAQNATIVAKKVSTSLERPVHLHDMAFSISASQGIASYPEHGTDTTLLMKYADLAMYSAKQDKEAFRIYTDALSPSDPNQLSVMGELRQAINEAQLQLHYQPKIDLSSRKIIGVEALVRWVHESRGFIPPDEFIPLAERTGLIKPLTVWVLEESMRQSKQWENDGIDISVAVNLSMQNIQDPLFPKVLSELMEKWNIDKHRLMFEITESTIMSNPDNVLRVLKEIEDMGVCLSIDDFGTGYSSLSNLKKLPVSELKIDRSFVMDMENDADDQAIVQSIIDMAHTMGLHVVAEGVENLEVTQQLTELGCDILQGYFISKPKPALDLHNMLKEGCWNVK